MLGVVTGLELAPRLSPRPKPIPSGPGVGCPGEPTAWGRGSRAALVGGEEEESRESSWDKRSVYDGGLGEVLGRSGAEGVWKVILDRREASGGSVFSSGVEWESFWASRSPVKQWEKVVKWTIFQEEACEMFGQMSHLFIICCES